MADEVEPNEITLNDNPIPPAMETPAANGHERYYQLDPGHISAERVAGLIFFAVVFVGALIALLAKFLHGGFDVIWFLMLAGTVVILSLQLWSALFWPRISYRQTRWKLDDAGLEILRGVWWKHRTSVPLARVQHADVSQGPLQRSYGIGTLTVHTAGTSNASVELAGLNHSVALDLRDRLVRQGKAGENVAA